MAVALQVQARALGDPTRHRIFRHIADADRPVDVAELTALLGLHHNAVRQHLAKLVDAQLVVERRAPTGGRGRPKFVYSLHPAAESRWDVTSPYERLSVLLAEVIRTGDPPEVVGRRSVRPRSLGTVDGSDPVDVLVDEMARRGFEPEVRRRGDGVDVTLQTCPFATPALVDPDTVCALHLGIAQGAADLTDGRIVVEELVPHDPRRAHCRLRVRVVDDGGRTEFL